MRWASNADGPQAEFVKLFRDNGFHVLYIFRLKNCCDLIISKGLMTAAIEVKDGSKPPSQRKLTDGEIKFKNEFQGLWYLCETKEDTQRIMNDLHEYIELLKVDFPEVVDLRE